VTRRVISIALALPLLLAATASARPAPAKPPSRVQIGHASLGRTVDGRPSILVPVTYPIQLAGRTTPLEVRLRDRNGKRIFRRKIRVRLSAGKPRSPERRRRFTFVHRIDLLDVPAVPIGAGMEVMVRAKGRVDVDNDGTPEIGSNDTSAQPLPLTARRRFCSTPAVVRTRPGRRTTVPLPACTKPVRWRIAQQPEHGQAHLEGGSLVYRSGPKFRGADTLTLSGGQTVGFTVGPGGEIKVRALGDSVTAGFGYYSNGEEMEVWELDDCRPGKKRFNDACSSNSLSRESEEGPVEYAPDFGYANGVSWAAQWARKYGLTNYKNYAISGSEPANWAPRTGQAPEGEFHWITEKIESEEPDYVLLTLGANPLLSEVLFGDGNILCGLESDILGGFRECIERLFEENHLRENLKRVYADLVTNTDATIYVMQYHLSEPSIALYTTNQIAEMGKLLNEEIAAVAATFNSQRLRVVTPPHFNVGVDLSPVYRSVELCPGTEYLVDGPSVQSTATQKEYKFDPFVSFCPGPASGPPWVISGDTGIHPSATGYTQMASRVPPPSG
jgi:lysophospholipase L1-like esterase